MSEILSIIVPSSAENEDQICGPNSLLPAVFNFKREMWTFYAAHSRCKGILRDEQMQCLEWLMVFSEMSEYRKQDHVTVFLPGVPGPFSFPLCPPSIIDYPLS